MTRRAAASLRLSLFSLALAGGLSPAVLLAQDAPETVYAPPALPSEDEGVNLGGVHFDLGITYLTDYLFRGVEHFEVPGAEDRLNLQFDTKLSFDLGKLPHPFVGLFANIAEDDPVSNFQEIRPTVGFDWLIKPVQISFGHTAYLYPERDEFETSEVFLQIGLDENTLFRGHPVPTPYVMGAYDYDLYEGLYFEGGVKYRLPFEDTGFTLTMIGKVAYVSGYNSTVRADDNTLLPGLFSNQNTQGDNASGFQRYEVGLIGEYSLNKLFNVSNRFGEWSLAGYLYYTDNIEDDLRADTQVWGGGGITFHY